MKKFILEILVFVTIIVMVALTMEALLRQIPNDYSYKKEYLDQHSNEVELLVIGGSHSLYGIDPKYFTKKCFNASHISQSIDINMAILKLYENKLDELKVLILPISSTGLFETLGKSTEYWRLKDYNIYYGMNKSLSLKNNTEILGNRFSINLKKIFFYYLKNSPNRFCTDLGWGTTYQSTHSKDLVITGKTAAARHHVKDFDQMEENIATLQTILTFCNERGIQLVLFTPPAYHTYRKYINKDQIDLTVGLMDKFSKSNDNCHYINLFEDSAFQENDFYDADHLNELGAQKLSLLLNEFIDKIESRNHKP